MNATSGDARSSELKPTEPPRGDRGHGSSIPFLQVGLWLLAALFCLGYGYLFRFTPVDDAMINLVYARTLAEHGVFGPVAGVTHYGFTSPLQLLLLAAVGKLVGFGSAIAVTSALELLLLLWACLRLAAKVWGGALGSNQHRTAGVVLFALIALNPLVISTLGLESLLGATLSVAALGALQARRWCESGLWLGGLMLVRPDYAVVAGLAVILFAFRKRVEVEPASEVTADSSTPGTPSTQSTSSWRGPGSSKGYLAKSQIAVAISACAAIPVAVWHTFAWLKLGSALPVTFFIKVSEGGWGDKGFFDGPFLYADWFPLMVALTVATLPASLLLLRRRTSGVSSNETERLASTKGLAVITALLGFGHALSLGLLGVAPYHWYYVPALSFWLMAVWLVVGSSGLAHRGDKGTYRFRLTMVGLGAFSFAGLMLVLATRGLPPEEAPIQTNWGTLLQYREVGNGVKELLAPGSRIRHQGEIGAIQFFSERNHHLDPFTDPTWVARSVLPAARRSSRLRRELTELNFRFFEVVPEPEPEYCMTTVLGSDDDPQKLTRGREALGEWQTGTRWRRVTWQLSRCM